ncbi:MAG: 23S rRNA (guanosine(2251)-2'-O)-methyltransferase RlmB [Eubacteriales bacterium]|nr:23S rRNA (guanosine(2251)-2'-O)-methyltransferase RlmB [Eubacteriales bacterium]
MDKDFENNTQLNDGELIAGRNPVKEAIKAGRDLEKLMVQKGEMSGSANQILALAREAGVRVQTVDKIHLDKLAKNHQGMVAFASAYEYAEVEDILNKAKEKNEKPFIVMLDQITDPHNLGAIMRSAVCTGAHGVIIPRHRAVGLTNAAVKAAAGAVEYIPVARVTNLAQTIKELKKQGLWVYGMDMGGKPYAETDFTSGVVIVIGSEGSGISKNVREACDEVLSIPMTGEIGSFNASVAAGIIMHRVFITR